MRRGFTLIEGLVTTTILAVLLVLLVPAIQTVRARAVSTQCVSNLRALGVSLNLYLAEHQMVMPDIEAGRADRNEDIPVIDNTLMDYVDDPAVFTCPAGRSVAEQSGTSYYWNSALRAQPVANLRLFWIEDPGKIPVLVDKEGWHKYAEDKVNHLFADGHVTHSLRLMAE